VRFLADPRAEWTAEAELDWDATAVMGNRRSKRFVAVVQVCEIMRGETDK
jgi:peroxiredoxin